MSSYHFPLRIVERLNAGNGTSLGRRGTGVMIAQGVCRLGDNGQIQVGADADNRVSLTAQISDAALNALFGLPCSKPFFENLPATELAVTFVEHHQYLLELDAKANSLSIACDLADTAADNLQGLYGLLGLGYVYLLSRWQGCPHRLALANVVNVYTSFSKIESDRLHTVLDSSVLDNGKLFKQFLQRTALVPATGTESIWLDQQITWLLGQDKVDLPYPRQAALAILQDETDADRQRAQLYCLLRGYDKALEQNNIQRIAADVREAKEQLIFGRMSRAFHNQATLFANAVLLQPTPEWRQLAAELAVLAEQTPSIQPSAGTLALFLNSAAEIPLTALEGACERFEAAVLDEQKNALANALMVSRIRVESHNDPLIDPLAAPFHPISAHEAIMAQAGQALGLVDRIRQAFLSAAKRHAAYVVISQRPSPTGSHLLIKINEFQDPYAGKAENLRKLVRLAGDRIYSSPDYGWLAVADHWIEAIPLFIKEEVLVQDGQESTRTVIDISGMEVSFREEMADYWASNLRQVLDSEWLSLARAVIAAEKLPDLDEEALRQHLRETGDADEIAVVAMYLAEIYPSRIHDIHVLIEKSALTPFAAMREILLDDGRLQQLKDHQQIAGSWQVSVYALLQNKGGDQAFSRFKAQAFSPRRPLPTLHVLTTQSAGMTEGYIRTWLEESMAFFNIAEDLQLHGQIAERETFFANRILSLGEKIIRELGVWIEVEELCASEQIPQAAAILRLINRNRLIQDELSCLGTLLAFAENQSGRKHAEDCCDPEAVEAYLHQHAEDLQAAALAEVIARNRDILSKHLDQGLGDGELRRVVLADEFYREDLQAYTRLIARRWVLAALDTEYPDQHLNESCGTYLRRFQQLRKTTARKEVIAEKGLNHLTLNPLYYFKASGGGKRYNLIYTPSRVDLGKRERESVETWAQWVGGADRIAAQTGRQIYSLINKDVRCFESLTEPEILKTGENASMATHFGFSNALSMMVTASAHGDFEAMADLMNRRFDRLIHPSGEGYGGYCVPKDGLFLEFVLTLNRAEKLRQIGLPEMYHEAVVALANRLLDRKPEFASQFEWEHWAAGQLQEHGCLKPYFSVSHGLPVFQITRIAHVLEHLGKPQLRDTYRVASSLAAGWGLHKMVTGGEQVNRFMPFFKAWLIRQGIAEASRRRPSANINFANSVIVLTAEYKPDTQDARFSTGLRKFEILSGTGGHLLNALDLDGRIIAVLMNEGFTGVQQRGWTNRLLDMMAINTDDQAAIAQLQQLFPPAAMPAEIRMVAPTGLSTQDLLNYTSDTQLESIADAARRELLALGLTDKEIEANLRTWGSRLEHWNYRLTADKRFLQQRLGSRTHALALAVLGPDRDYPYAVQGADVIDTGIPHSGLLELLDDPNRLCRLMLEGNPNSALVMVDGAAGARHRAMNRGNVMLWFAAAERLGKESVYLGVGVGGQTVETWRSDMRQRRSRAQRLWSAISGQDKALAKQLYAGIVSDIQQDYETHSALAETDKLRRFGRVGERDQVLAQALAGIGNSPSVETLNFIGFLALGGLYLFVGADENEIHAAIADFAAGIASLGGTASITDGDLVLRLLSAQRQGQAAEFRQEKGVESSNKAMDERPAVALETRRQLAARIAQARALNLRQAGFTEAQAGADDFSEHYRKAMAALGDGEHPVSETAFGMFLKFTRNALTALAKTYADDAHPEHSHTMLANLEQLCSGRQIDAQAYQRIAGGYEDIGDFGRMAQSVRERAQQGKIDGAAKGQALHCIAQGGELFYIVLAIDSTIAYTQQEPMATDTVPLWRDLCSFFAKTLNDHSYEYRPWLYSRGIGYADYHGEALYRLAVAHHQWLYRYLRFVVTCYTELRDMPKQGQDMLLGNYLDACAVTAIGADADGEAEKAWRAYGQLRELAFIRNDGFPVPEVFSEFDPELICGHTRINHIIAAPVGRTHFSRMLCEGPTLAQELEVAGRRGSNLIITRKLSIAELPEYPRPVALINSGHFYLDTASYEQALIKHKGFSKLDAANLAAQLPPKGIRVAAHFTRPVLAALVYPFHGDPIYKQGKLEDCGLPYTVQSLFHTWTSYDKAKYRGIFSGSEVDMPEEINWLSDDTARSPEKSVVKGWIKQGFAETGYPGLLAFAQKHPLVMVKDAAESGGRNAQAFQLLRSDGSLDNGQIGQAVDFIYQISLKHHVCIQEVILSSLEHWATEEFMQSFVHRQIVEWGSAVNRQRLPYTPIFGSHRIILSTDNPSNPSALQNWHISHWITLNSKQVITNVGRGGTLDLLLPETIRPEYRQTILSKLAEAGKQVMAAMAAYEARGAAAYAKETGREVGSDLTGVSYGMPRYMMLDFLITPVFAQEGQLLGIEPVFDEKGCRVASRFILQHGGQRFPATVADWRIVLIEPNIGVGLWDRVALREEFHELERARIEGINPDWNHIGENARIVLRDLNRAGEDYLHRLMAKAD